MCSREFSDQVAPGCRVNWQMALPMVALSVVVLLTPVLLVRLGRSMACWPFSLGSCAGR